MNVIRTIKKYFRDSLYINAFFLMTNSLLASIFGLVFLIIITNFYTLSEIGLFSAILSVSGIIAALAKLGFDMTIVRFLPISSDKSTDLINNCFIISGIVALSITILYIITIDIWSPALKIIQTNFFYGLTLILLVILSDIYNLQMSIFIAKKATKFLIIRNTMINIVKVVFAILLTSLKFFGILMSHILGLFLSFSAAIFVYMSKIDKDYRFHFRINQKIISEILPFSIGNYVAGIFGTIQFLILPLIVFNTLGSENAGYFFVAWSISQIIFTISGSVSTSFFAEGSVDSKGSVNLIKRMSESLVVILLITSLSILVLFLVGFQILSIFGKTIPKNAINLLSVLCLVAMPNAIVELLCNYRRIEKKVKTITFYSIIDFSLILLLPYYLIINQGLIGVAIGLFLAKLIITIVIIIDFRWNLVGSLLHEE